MWFKCAVGKEKVNFMFNADFSIENMELISFSFNHSRLCLSFCTRHIPKTYPKKWDCDGFNSILLGISLSEIISFESKGNNVMFTSSPKIETTSEFSIIEINNPELFLYCKARFLTIENIQPYIDDRWD